MNPLTAFFISGDSLYPGAALLLFAALLSLRLKRTFELRVQNITALIGLAMMTMASPPLPWITDLLFLSAFALWLFAVNSARPSTQLRIGSSVLLTMLILLMASVELRHRMFPKITGTPSDHLVVIGDSVSAGLGSRKTGWPAVFQQITGIEVKNLAQAAATTADGNLMAEKVDGRDTLVLIELGGNDMIMGGSSDQFGRNLEFILANLTTRGRTLIMFELPLLPQWIPYGQIQRQLAAKYRVFLIPKRFFVSVISAPDATSDGIHLTDSGAHRMAALVADILGPLLIKYPTAPAP